MRLFNLSLVLVVGVAAWSGCSKGASEPEPGASQGNEAPPVPATGTTPMTKLSDGQIAEILMTVDSGEIEQAQLALKRATDPEVRAFATHMIQQHTDAKQAGSQLATQAPLRPTESPKSLELQQSSAKMLSALNAADEHNFDITYIDGQIQQHEEALRLMTYDTDRTVVEAALAQLDAESAAGVGRAARQ